MTRSNDHQCYIPQPISDDYIKEHQNNLRWLTALRDALKRGLTDKAAGDEANDAVPEALEPSRFAEGTAQASASSENDRQATSRGIALQHEKDFNNDDVRSPPTRAVERAIVSSRSLVGERAPCSVA